MPRNHHRPGSSASHSFQKAEVDAAVQLMDALYRGSDVSVLLRNRSLAAVYRKFTYMQQKIDRERWVHGADGTSDGT